MVKNCDLGLENAARGRRSQFFTIRTSQPANNIYALIGVPKIVFEIKAVPMSL